MGDLKCHTLQVLNIVCVFGSMTICNELLRNKFWTYGSDIYQFAMYAKKTEAGVGEWSYPNVKCNLFPTEVQIKFNILFLNPIPFRRFPATLLLAA